MEQMKVALQTWTIRRELLLNTEETLKKIRRLGIEHLEVANIGRNSPEKFAEICRSHGFKIAGTHEPPLTSGDLKTLIAEVKARCHAFDTQLVTVMLDPDHRGNQKAYIDYARLCKEAGKMLKEDGIDLCYHLYHYDLAPLGRPPAEKCGLAAR